mmetsp:Transcript_61463/g.150422  ORF Transcript_61463/g.150422 Transcript_61463/m.150422 type:complete len:547 (+) Transcript_61463:263-1903(+)
MQKSTAGTTKWDLLKGRSLSISTDCESVDNEDVEEARRPVDLPQNTKQAPKQKQNKQQYGKYDDDGGKFKVLKRSLTCRLKNNEKTKGRGSVVAVVKKTMIIAALLILLVVIDHVQFQKKIVNDTIFSGATTSTVKAATAAAATTVVSGPTDAEASSRKDDDDDDDDASSREKSGTTFTATTYVVDETNKTKVGTETTTFTFTNATATVEEVVVVVESTVTASNDTATATTTNANATATAALHLAGERSVAICAIMKDEELYLEEWFLYYLALGVDRIYIYNDSDNSTKLEDFVKSLVGTTDEGENDTRRNTTEGLLPEDFVTIFNLKRVGSRTRQIRAYRNCMRRYVRPNNHTWAGFLDPDEFLVLRKHKTLKDFLSEKAPEGSVSINWVDFGTSNETSYRPRPVTQRFQYHMGTQWTVKTFVKAEDYKDRQSPHWVHLRDNNMRRDPDGVWIRGTNKLPNSNQTNSAFNPTFHVEGRSDVAALFHYRTKSLGEYMTKFCERGDVFDSKQCDNATFSNVEPGYIHDDSAWKFLREHYPNKYSGAS